MVLSRLIGYGSAAAGTAVIASSVEGWGAVIAGVAMIIGGLVAASDVADNWGDS
jgi:sulfite exporter TauE/SafE